MTHNQQNPDALTDSTRLNRIFSEQKKAYADHPFPTFEERRANLSALNAAIAKNKEALIEAIDQDFGCRSRTETILAEILGSHNAIHYMQKHLRKFMRPRRRGVGLWSFPAKNVVLPQPLGVVAIMSPWNYALHLAVSPLVCALGAGNRAIVVMSEQTPMLCALFATIIAETFEEDHVCVFQGGAISPEVSTLPFDHILFTGSTRVGKLIARSAAEHLTPLTLELGGKSPAIVTSDYDITEAAERISWAKVYNAGQTCIAPDYVFVPKGTRDVFVTAALEKFNKGYSGIDDKDLTAIVNETFYNRLNALVDEAEANGATVFRPEGVTPEIIVGAFGNIYKMPLTIVIDAPDDCALMQEEIFGPVLPVKEYDDLNEVICYINQRDRPLALYVYSNDKAARHELLHKTVSGQVGLNDALMQYIQEDMAFGGVGMSGQGAYHGQAGFDRFSHLKSVFQQRGIGTFTGAKLLHPPYGRVGKFVLRLMGG